MERFQFQELTVTWSQQEGRQLLYFTGRSMSRHPALIMGPMWSQVLQVAREGGRAIELDFVRIEHFNSSTISALVQFINESRAAGVKIVIRYDATLKWQALSFNALERVAAAFGDDGVLITRVS
jgi:hypothetical protein